MERDATAIRKGKPIVFTNLKTGDGLDRVIAWIRHDVLFEAAAS
jgi:urease accessory protein